ncbi:DUF1490 family protein [Tsukamurella sp. 8J]|uniref:DUF1490 family protein n=1 Tax=Tsukamurella sp. 8J TaxID=3031962 RepID=UPI0023B89D91|nr:DUF1490 family protein [Tsukamurella sp. 8J]MDF0531865.1 DUF1490 family protein [Tsukamurella sp. 8J]
MSKPDDAQRSLRRAGAVVVSGVVGALVVDGAKRFANSGALRRAAVSATALGLRGARSAETSAESARLAVADVVAEAREQIGEQAPPPSAPGEAHDHSH